MGHCRFTIKVHKFLTFFIGQDRYTAISKLYVKGSLGCIIVADVMNPESLASTEKWKEVIEENADLVGGEKIPILLLQNKCDLLDNVVKKEEYQSPEYLSSFSQKNNFNACFQVSAKSDTNLDKAIEILVSEILKLNIMESSRDNFFRRSGRYSESIKLSQNSVLVTEKNTAKEKSKDKKCNC